MDGVAPLVVDKLAKTFRTPFSGRPVHAVREVSFEVAKGEIFGFLGPNGAGKSTTLKMLMGLVLPTSGRAAIFGRAVPAPDVMARVGFLPENPSIYPYLTGREFVALCARLSGVSGVRIRTRVEAALARVRMLGAADRSVRTYSKGMLQRVALASALVHDPELLVLDEPMSGLDPVGRKELRDLILDEKRAGRTVVFSSHILSDVEMLCDRMCILRAGEVVASGSIGALLDTGSRRVEITLAGADAALRATLASEGHVPQTVGDYLVIEVEGEARVRSVIERAYGSGARVESVIPKRERLEDVFVKKATE
jgi:ABC-2 type transport system ATP-binding protein